MILKSCKIEGLNRSLNVDLTFHNDMNLLTGQNGSGKTSILKFMWFLVSGNAEWIWPEVQFKSAHLETDLFKLSGAVTEQKSGVISIDWVFTEFAKGKDEVFHVDLRSDAVGPEEKSNKLNARILTLSRSSLFFPTFRRIEGGYRMNQSRREYSAAGRAYFGNDVSGVVNDLAERLSVRNHKFVASISTDDIVRNLTLSYANMSERVNEDHRALSREIISEIQKYEASSQTNSEAKLSNAEHILGEIQKKVRLHSDQQDRILKPFAALSDLIGQIFQHKGIRLTERLTLGKAEESINSDVMSAGEKQMLSFLAYNAFQVNSMIFIDEPEISLHVDWQRRLFPILFGQGTKNQFIVATHSPFIYTKFADKEVLVGANRGDTDGEDAPHG